MKLPAGIVDHDIEFFLFRGNLMFLHNGRARSFDKLPAEMISYLHDLLASIPDADLCLDCMDLQEPAHLSFEMRRLYQFVLCRFSSFDLVADITEGGHMAPEHTLCDKRGRCPYEGILCVPVAKSKLSSRELEVIRMLPEDLPFKLIADRMGITTNTVRTHIQNIQSKIGVHSHRAILAWAYEHDLIDQQSFINNNSLWETERTEKVAVRSGVGYALPRTF